MRFIASLWRFSVLANLAFLNANLFHDLPSDENGQFVVQWNLGIGDQTSVLETSYLKSGLEQAVKDFLNLKLKCQPTKNQIKTSFRSLAIRKIATSSGKQQILTGTGKCVGSKDDCKKSLRETDSTDKKKDQPRTPPSTGVMTHARRPSSIYLIKSSLMACSSIIMLI